MKRNRRLVILLAGLFMSAVAFAQSNKMAVDYLQVPGPITFDSKLYQLNWSTHPAANFYKQEYIVKGDNADKYNAMILVDAVTGNTVIKNVVAAKVAELKKMKEANPVINYEVIDNPKTGEYLLDFLVTANAPNGTITIVERNVYRYKTYTGKGGNKGVLLFGISTRAYGAAVNGFMTALQTNRKDLMNKVAQFNISQLMDE